MVEKRWTALFKMVYSKSLLAGYSCMSVYKFIAIKADTHGVTC